MTVFCPVCAEFSITYDPAEVTALAAESPIGIEQTNGWNFASVIEFPLREHVRIAHTHTDVQRVTRQRWWL